MKHACSQLQILGGHRKKTHQDTVHGIELVPQHYPLLKHLTNLGLPSDTFALNDALEGRAVVAP